MLLQNALRQLPRFLHARSRDKDEARREGHLLSVAALYERRILIFGWPGLLVVRARKARRRSPEDSGQPRIERGLGVTSCGLRPPGQQVARATHQVKISVNCGASFFTSGTNSVRSIQPPPRTRSPT